MLRVATVYALDVSCPRLGSEWTAATVLDSAIELFRPPKQTMIACCCHKTQVAQQTWIQVPTASSSSYVRQHAKSWNHRGLKEDLIYIIILCLPKREVLKFLSFAFTKPIQFTHQISCFDWNTGHGGIVSHVSAADSPLHNLCK